MPVADAVVGALLSDWQPRRVLPHALVATSAAILVYPSIKAEVGSLVISSFLILIGLLVWLGAESEVKRGLNQSLRSVMSSFDFDKLLSLIFDVLERERSFFSDLFESASLAPLLRFAAMLAVRSIGFYLVLFGAVASVNTIILLTSGIDYMASATSMGGELVIFLIVVALVITILGNRMETSEEKEAGTKNPLAKDVVGLYFYGNFQKVLSGLSGILKDVASLLTFPMTGKNPFAFDSMQDLYFPNGLIDTFVKEVEAGRLAVKDSTEYEQFRATDQRGTGLTELLKLTQNEILKLTFSGSPDQTLSKYKVVRCRFTFPNKGGSVVVSAFKGCLSSVERIKAFRGVRQRRIAAFLVFAVGEKKPVSDLKLKLDLNAKKVTSELAACEGP